MIDHGSCRWMSKDHCSWYGVLRTCTGAAIESPRFVANPRELPVGSAIPCGNGLERLKVGVTPSGCATMLEVARLKPCVWSRSVDSKGLGNTPKPARSTVLFPIL